MTIVLGLIIGLIAGLVGAGVGSAGGTIMVPLLQMSKLVPNYKTAVGTVLFSILPPVSIGAIMTYWKANEVDWKLGIVLMIANIIGGWLSAKYIVKNVSNKNLELFYAIYLFVLSGYFFWKYKFSDN
jgi:uncharacterized membrane protein YfcA